MEQLWYILEDNLPIIAKVFLWLNNVLLHYIWLPGGGVKGNSQACHSSLTWWQVRSLCDSFWPMEGQTRNLFEILWPTWGEARSLSKFFWPIWGQTGSLCEHYGLHEAKSGVYAVLAPHKSELGGGMFIIVKSDMWHSAFTTCVVNIGLRTFWSFCCFGIIQILGVIRV
jgi:hypothetical protein